ncbi:hypothetical protein BU17DRAFT_80658 [Hysterangium stoloniferum]|nr:hypothetical protein BU17DRAFT_80658 [Hysterangium stoloniferum]
MPPSRRSKSKPSPSLPSLSRREQDSPRPPPTSPIPLPVLAVTAAGPTTASPVPAPPSVSPPSIVLPPRSSILTQPPLTSHTPVSALTSEVSTWRAPLVPGSRVHLRMQDPRRALFTHHPLHVRRHLKLRPIRANTPRHPSLPSIRSLFPHIDFQHQQGLFNPQSHIINTIHPPIYFANANVWEDDYS